MSRQYLSGVERELAIVAAACSLIEECGVAAVTNTAVAARADVTRQWLYEFFPDTESILVAVYAQWERCFRRDALVACGNYVSLNDHLKEVSEHWLTMPVASAMVGLYALYCNRDGDGTAARVHRHIITNLDEGWVTPLVDAGLDRDRAAACVLGMNATAYAQRVAIHNELTTLDAARWYLHAVIDGLAPPELTA